MTIELVTADNASNFELIPNDEEYILDLKSAQELTESIKSTATATCLLLQQAHDKKAWQTMGYKTWAEYIENEFKFSRGRSYQLLSQASVIKEISEVSNSEIFLTEKEAKLIKKELPKITEKLSTETKDLETEEERKEKANAILKDEISQAMKNDKNTYDEGVELANQEKESNGGGQYSGQSQVQEDDDPWGPKPVKEEKINNPGEANFYVENLMRTLSIMEAFPNSKDLSKLIKSGKSKEEEIEFRNRVKYSISWLTSLLDELK